MSNYFNVFAVQLLDKFHTTTPRSVVNYNNWMVQNKNIHLSVRREMQYSFVLI